MLDFAKVKKTGQGTYLLECTCNEIAEHVGTGYSIWYVVRWYQYTAQDKARELLDHIAQLFVALY